MAQNKLQKLELTWIGKGDERKEKLLTEAETRLKQSIRLTELFMIKCKII